MVWHLSTRLRGGRTHMPGVVGATSSTRIALETKKVLFYVQACALHKHIPVKTTVKSFHRPNCLPTKTLVIIIQQWVQCCKPVLPLQRVAVGPCVSPVEGVVECARQVARDGAALGILLLLPHHSLVSVQLGLDVLACTCGVKGHTRSLGKLGRDKQHKLVLLHQGCRGTSGPALAVQNS